MGQVRAKQAGEYDDEEEKDGGEIGKEALSAGALEALQLHLVEKDNAAATGSADGRYVTSSPWYTKF